MSILASSGNPRANMHDEALFPAGGMLCVVLVCNEQVGMRKKQLNNANATTITPQTCVAIWSTGGEAAIIDMEGGGGTK